MRFFFSKWESKICGYESQWPCLLSNIIFLQFQLGQDQGSYPKELNGTLKSLLMMVKDYQLCIVSWLLQQWLYINQWSCCRTVLPSKFFSTHQRPVLMVLLQLLFYLLLFLLSKDRLRQASLGVLVRVYLSVKHSTLFLCTMDRSRSACYQSIVSLHWWLFPCSEILYSVPMQKN